MQILVLPVLVLPTMVLEPAAPSAALEVKPSRTVEQTSFRLEALQMEEGGGRAFTAIEALKAVLCMAA